MRDLCKRVIIFFTFICFAAGIALVITALATENWIVSYPVKHPGNETSAATAASQARELNKLEVIGNSLDPKKLSEASYVHSGLFVGSRQINWGLGSRRDKFNVREELDECDEKAECASFMTFGLWVCIVLFAVLAVLWGGVGIVFSLINTVIRPIETIAGPLGIYLWSSLAVFCSFVAVILYVVQYYTTITESVLLNYQKQAGFSSADLTYLGFSFWLMVGSIGAFGLNLILLLISGLEMKTRYGSKDKHMPHITDGGVLMY